MIVDSYKLVHWMNVRKVTPAQLAMTAEIEEEELRELLRHDRGSIGDVKGARLCDALRVGEGQLATTGDRGVTAIVATAEELRATRRPIQRDGIHFYNYYSMAAPPGRVAPVILDILCPPERLPALNNGHLEPAITLNLGPGDIYGRWGEELTEATWSVLHANHGADSWIVGDSYVEPSYCPHSYSRASDSPARIISYTCESNLAPLFAELNNWGDPAFDAMTRETGRATGPDMLRAALTRRGFDAGAAVRLSGVDEHELRAYLAGHAEALGSGRLAALGDALGFDYRILLPPPRRHDSVGKTSCTIDESRASVRDYRGYTVASMAAAPHLPDLVGLFVRVERRDAALELDLCEYGETHYLAVSGTIALAWRKAGGGIGKATLTPDATAWIGPYVEHGFAGDGTLIKLGSGAKTGYLDQLELTNTFAPAATLARGRNDAVGWGFDDSDLALAGAERDAERERAGRKPEATEVAR